MDYPCQKTVDIHIDNDYHYLIKDMSATGYYKEEKQMVDKYNESSQLRVRLAILESQLKIANQKVEQLERLNKIKNSLTKPSQAK